MRKGDTRQERMLKMVSQVEKVHGVVTASDTRVCHLENALAWAVIATVFFLPTSEALKNIAFVVSLALYAAIVVAGRERIVVPPAGWFFLGLLAAAMLSAAVSPYPGKAITGVWEIFRYTSFLFLVARSLRQEKHVGAALWAAVTGLGLTAVITIPRYLMTDGAVFALSLGGNDATALYAVMVLALIFGMYVHADIAGWRLICLTAVAGLSVMLLGITHVRMLWGGFILIGVFLGWLRSGRVAPTAVAISIVIVLGLGLVNPVIKQQVASLGNIETYENMGEGPTRREQWKKGLAMWWDAPWLGIGPKGFILHDDAAHNPQRGKYGVIESHPHNMWIYTAVEMGAVGLLILAATFGYLGFWLLRWRSRFSSSWATAIWDGAFGSWLAILIAGLTAPGFGAENAMLFMMLLGLLGPRVGAGEGNPRGV